MAVTQATVQGIKLLQGNPHGAGARKVFLVTMSFAAATAGDTASVSNLHTAIQDAQRNGKTFTIRRAMPGQPGTDASGNAVYATATITAGTTAGQVDFALGGVTAAAAVNASNGVSMLIMGDES